MGFSMTEQTEKPQETAVKKQRNQRARNHFRKMAERLNPSPFAQVFDSRGRPRHKPRHTFVKA